MDSSDKKPCAFRTTCTKEQCKRLHVEPRWFDTVMAKVPESVSKETRRALADALLEHIGLLGSTRALARGGNSFGEEKEKAEFRAQELEGQLQGCSFGLDACMELKGKIRAQDMERRVKRETFRLRARLPALALRRPFIEAAKAHRCLVVKGETGSGKSTQLPVYLADSFAGSVICTQPRPLAAQTLAQRVALEYSGGENASSEWVRYWGDRKKITKEERAALQRSNRVTFMSEAQLVSLLANKGHNLAGIAAIVIDEAHERTIYTDILLGLLREPKQRWEHVKLVVTSATMDTEVFCQFLGNAPLLRVPGRLHPVKIEHAPQFMHELPADGIGRAAIKELLEEEEGDCLVFLPGKSEIADAAAAAKAWCRANAVCVVDADPPAAKTDPDVLYVQILELYGQQEPEEQARVFAKAERSRKLIFSTNIAETSLTIDGVRLVIDSGSAKENTFDGKSGMSVVEECRISQSSAIQRAGRAGRTAPGRCLRLYSVETFELMSASRAPDVFRNPLSQTLLLLAAFGFTAQQFAWLSRPSDEAIRSAETELALLEALEMRADGVPQLTPLGRLIPRLMVEPRLAKMLLVGVSRQVGRAACLLAAILPQHSSLVHRGGPKEKPADVEARRAAMERFACKDGDLITLFRAIASLKQGGGLFAAAKQLGLRAKAVQSVLTTAKDLERQLVKAGVWQLPQDVEPDDDLLRALAASALGRSLSLAQRSRWDRVVCVESGLVGRISSRLPKDDNAPAGFLLWTSCTQVDANVYYSGWVKTNAEEMQAAAPQFYNALEAKLQHLPSHEIALPPVSHSIARTVLTKWRSSANGRRWALDYDVASGVVRAVVAPAESAQVKRLLEECVAQVAGDVELEISEEPIAGGGVLVLGAGGRATHLLPPDAFLRMFLTGVGDRYSAAALAAALKKVAPQLPAHAALQVFEGGKAEMLFGDHVKAAEAYALLNGEMLDGVALRASAIHCGASTGRERASASLDLIWALGVSRGKASILFDSEPAMRVCLQKGGQLLALLGGGAKIFLHKPKEGVVEKERFQVDLTHLQPNMDEVFLEERLRMLGIVWKHVLVRRVAAEQQNNNNNNNNEEILGVQLAEIRALVPLPDRIKSQTSFALETSLRAGLKIFYESREDCEEALRHFDRAELPLRCGQPVRLQASFRYQYQIHVNVFALRKKRFEDIAEAARQGGVSVTFKSSKLQKKDATTLKEQDAVTISLSSARAPFLDVIMQRFRDAAAGILWSAPEKDRMFSRLGRQLLEKYSSDECHIHWVVATKSIWVYVADGVAAEQALAMLREMAKGLEELQLDVAIPLRRGGPLPTRAQLAQIPYAEVSKNKRLLWVCAKADQVEKLRADFGAPARNAGATETESCSVCFCDLEDPVTLSLCGHRFDTECLLMNINQPDLPLPIVCPRDGCRKPLALRDIMVICAKSPEVLTSIKEKALDNFLMQHGATCSARRCPANDCADILFDDHCSSCAKSYCWTCTADLGKPCEKHQGSTCAEWRAGLTPANMDHKRYIEEHLMTLHCPRCSQAFVDFSACAAIRCHKCACGFCACCLQDCGSDAHDHLANGCARNPNGRDYFIREDQFRSIHRDRIRADIVAYLAAKVKTPEDRAAVLLLIQKSLRDLQIDLK